MESSSRLPQSIASVDWVSWVRAVLSSHTEYSDPPYLASPIKAARSDPPMPLRRSVNQRARSARISWASITTCASGQAHTRMSVAVTTGTRERQPVRSTCRCRRQSDPPCGAGRRCRVHGDVGDRDAGRSAGLILETCAFSF